MGLAAFDWLKRTPEVRVRARSEESVSDLLARRKYARAIELLRAQFQAGNRSPELRLQYADALVGAGRSEEAVPVLMGVADELATAAPARAAEALRRIERVEPGREDVAMRLASLGQCP